jgi:general secretion pathway protein C
MLSAIRPNSAYSQLGLVDGDVILRINDHDTTSPAKLLDAWAQLKDADRIEIDLERECETVRKTYVVR